MSTTIDQLEVKVKNLETKIQGLSTIVNKLNTDLLLKSNATDLNRIRAELYELINDNSELISKIDEQLAKVILPEDTRYYLEESEVSDFQSNFNKLKAMMIQFDRLYKNLVAYEANLE
jgi:septal ring factor EnvC (AmiA/AmiB activator)